MRGYRVVVSSKNFVLRYESANTKIIPVAYAVTNEENIIINMVASLVTTTQVYDKDAILHAAHNVADKLDDISRARNHLQSDIGKISNRLMKTSMSIVAAESNIRQSLDVLKCELSTTQIDAKSTLTSLENNIWFTRQSNITKNLVTKVIYKIQKVTLVGDLTSIQWKLAAKKCTNIASGISFYASRVDVNFLRINIMPERIVEMISMFGGKVTLADDLNIIIDSSTINQIMSPIN